MRSTARVGGVAAVILFGLVVAAPPARAQSDAAVREARAHFERGLEFFNEGRHDAALAEFTRAYELAPAPPVLYNIARVQEALGHAVEAADAYDQYLRESADMPASRRAEVQRALERQRARVAHLTVRTNVEGATVSIDGVDVATTPLAEPLRLSAGDHTVGVRAAGYDSTRRAIRLAGGDRQTMALELTALVDQRGTLRIVSSAPDVEVRLGERVLGRTPLASTVPVAPGRHTVVGRRPGYREERVTVDVEAGAETEVRLEMRTDEGAPADARGQLRIHLPDSPAVVRIDGEPVLLTAGAITLPVGRHLVELEVAEREPFQTTVDVPAGEGVDLTPELLWTPAARAERAASASSTRTWGQVVTLAGIGVLAGGVGLFVWNENRIASTDREIVDVQEQFDRDCPGSPNCADLEAEGKRLNDERDSQDTMRLLTWIIGGAGIVTAGAGLVLWLGAPSDEDIDEAAHASGPSLRLRAGLGTLSLEGTF